MALFVLVLAALAYSYQVGAIGLGFVDSSFFCILLPFGFLLVFSMGRYFASVGRRKNCPPYKRYRPSIAFLHPSGVIVWLTAYDVLIERDVFILTAGGPTADKLLSAISRMISGLFLRACPSKLVLSLSLCVIGVCCIWSVGNIGQAS